jgi:hypothetical protein
MASEASAYRLGELSRKNPVTQQWRPIVRKQAAEQQGDF